MSQSWKVERWFSTYQEAAQLKSTLQESTRGAILQFKISRYEPKDGKELFAVKSRTEPSLVAAEKEIEEKLSKTKR
jgi:hypothetical protein